MTHLGLVVYCWEDRAQNRLLADCLGPAAQDLRKEGLAERFWFDRYDARGPHLFCVLTVPPGAAPEAARRVGARLDEHLTAHPGGGALSREELERRHRETRGRRQCELDGEAGIGENNTYRFFEHALRSYPFGHTEGLPREDELWLRVQDLSFWTIGQLSAGSGAALSAGVRWIIALDRALRCTGEAGCYWRHHAATLLLPLRERLRRDEEEVVASLPVWIGERNRHTFSRLWDQEPLEDEVWRHGEELVRLALPEQGGPEGRRWTALREIDHVVLKQLGIPVSLHIPLVLYAWHRNVGQPAA